MKENPIYLVSDLAQELGVPRTTVNDWLKRFDRYIVYVMSGRRKAYGTLALEVLKEISKLRNEGVSNSGIDELLSRKYPIRPEIAGEEMPESKTEIETMPVKKDISALLPAYLEQGEKLFLQQQKEANKKVFSFMLLMAVLVIFSVALSVVFTVIYFGRSSRMMAQERAVLEKKLSDMERLDQEKTLLYQQKILALEDKLVQSNMQSDQLAAEQLGTINALRKELGDSLIRVSEQLENSHKDISEQFNEFSRSDDQKDLVYQEKLAEQRSMQELQAQELKIMQEKLKQQQQQLEQALIKLNEVSGKITDLNFKSSAPAVSAVPAVNDQLQVK